MHYTELYDNLRQCNNTIIYSKKTIRPVYMHISRLHGINPWTSHFIYWSSVLSHTELFSPIRLANVHELVSRQVPSWQYSSQMVGYPINSWIGFLSIFLSCRSSNWFVSVTVLNLTERFPPKDKLTKQV